MEGYSFTQADSSIIVDSDGQLSICARNDKRVGSNGFWNGDNPLDYVLPVTLVQIVLAIVASQLVYFLLRPFRTPRFICSVLGGMLLGPSFLGHSSKFRDTLYPPRQAVFLGTASTIAGSYFIFIVALQMDVTTTLRAAKRTWRFGIVPFLASLAVVSSLVYANDRSLPNIRSPSLRTFFSAIMSFSNFIVISDSLKELNLASSELGQIALSSSMINDTMQWLTLLLMSFVSNTDLEHSFEYLIFYWLLIFFCIFAIRPIMMMIAKNTPVGKPVKEVYIMCILAGVLVMAAAADVMGLSFLQGPLLFGLIMPNGPPLGTTLIEKTQTIMADFLMPLFFVYIGTNTNIYELQRWSEITTLFGIILVGYVVKVLACLLVAASYNIRAKHGLVLGLMLNVKGIVELMAFTRMKRLKVLDEQGFTQLVLSVLLMTSIISPLIKVLYKPHARPEISTKDGGMKMRTIQDTVINSQFCIISCVYDEGNVHSHMALLEACNPRTASPIRSHVVHFVELLGKSTPFLLPLDGKRSRKTLSINYPNTHHIVRAFENYAQNSNGQVKVQPYVNVAPYKQMHEAICSLAHVENVPFLVIPFHENNQTLGSHMITSLHDLNRNFQLYAPCTVGILVDRCSQISMMNNGSDDHEFCFHVGIFFIGGPDDREALSLGIRMATNEKTKVTLFSFVMNKDGDKNQISDNKREDQEEDEEMERMLDNSFIDEFKVMGIGNSNIKIEEVMVEDEIGALEAIPRLEGKYDLVMVGRRHNMVNLDDEEMSILMENVETLGVFGDTLSSTEFCGGTVPVLVMQCGGHKYGHWVNGIHTTSPPNLSSSESFSSRSFF